MKLSTLIARVLCFGILSAVGDGSAFAAAATPDGLSATSNCVASASSFLATLSESERATVLFAFTDEVQRKNWSNLPTPMFKRAGLRLGDLSASKREAAMRLLATLLSPMGFEKTIRIVEGDQVLGESPGGPKGPVFSRDEYFLSFLGKPSLTDPWMLQFGGHHLALNITIHGSRGILTPSHTAAQPATYTRNGKTVRPLAGEYDKSFVLLNSLNVEQKAKAIIGSRMADLVLGPGHDGQSILPEGIKGADLSASQHALLLELIQEWVGMIHIAAADQKMAEVKVNLAETYFAWSGPTTPGSAAYYRIQGPTVLVEFAPQHLGGIPTNHIHTIYRDPTNDYGRKHAVP